MKQLLLLNPENVSGREIRNYPVRKAARAVVVDKNNRVALLHVSRKNYYKLPGGGLEGDEDKITALKRECKEEIGSDIEVIGEIGKIVEYRKFSQLKQISYCYFAKLKGKKSIPNFTEKEIAGGFKLMWVSYDKALRLMEESRAKNIEGREYIVPRDIAFLKAAKRYLK